MGFVSVTCSNCDGQGLITVEYFQGMIMAYRKKTCNECEGVGSHLIHANSIKPYYLSVDPSGANEDDTWAVVWQKQDDGGIDLVDMFSLGEVKRTPFDQSR